MTRYGSQVWQDIKTYSTVIRNDIVIHLSFIRKTLIKMFHFDNKLLLLDVAQKIEINIFICQSKKKYGSDTFNM